MKSEIKKQLTWDVTENKIFLPNGNEIDGYKAITRTDNEKILSIMKDSYEPMTNAEFSDRVQKLIEISGFTPEGYTDLKEGQKVLAFLKNTKENLKIGKHKIQDYLVVGNSHDGSNSFFVGTSTTLIRCTNQFSRIGRITKVKHTKNKEIKMEEMFAYLETFFKQREEMYGQFNKFGDRIVTKELIEKAVRYVMDIKETDKLDELSTRKMNQIEVLNAAINREMGELGNNAWGLFNGFTWYTSHDLKEKEKTFGNLFGTSAKINNRAYEFCTELV